MNELADIETDETVGYYVKGQVDPDEFAGDFDDVDPEDVQHCLFRNVPNGDSPTGREIREVEEEKPGAFKVTVAYV